jgi:hypothetical protein
MTPVSATMAINRHSLVFAPQATRRACAANFALFAFLRLDHHANHRARQRINRQHPNVHCVAQDGAFRTIRTRHHHIHRAFKPREPTVVRGRGEHTDVDLPRRQLFGYCLFDDLHRLV